jgi:hypothetical protein
MGLQDDRSPAPTSSATEALSHPTPSRGSSDRTPTFVLTASAPGVTTVTCDGGDCDCVGICGDNAECRAVGDAFSQSVCTIAEANGAATMDARMVRRSRGR